MQGTYLSHIGYKKHVNIWYLSGKDNVNVSYMIKLKMHDMIYIEKVKDGRADTGGSQKHFFEGRYIP